MKKLQIALDEFSLEEILALCEKVRDYIDIIEIGTPFIMREGMGTVIAFRERFPEKEILADAILKSLTMQPACSCGTYELPDNLKRFYEGKAQKDGKK